MIISRFFNLIFALIFISNLSLYAQGKEYQGPEDPAGDIAAEKEGYMTGNRVFIYFRNTTELSDWPRVNVSKWPNNPDGLKMTDGIGLLVGAKVYIEDDGNPETVDSIPITDHRISMMPVSLNILSIIYNQVIGKKWILTLLGR